jgi:hypothetical protein
VPVPDVSITVDVLVVLVELVELVELFAPPASAGVVVEEVEEADRLVVDVLVPRLVGPAGGCGPGKDTPAPRAATTTTLPPTAAAPPMHRRSSIGLLPATAPTRSPAGASRTRSPAPQHVFKAG